MLSIIGGWGDALDPKRYANLYQQVVQRFNCRCTYCNFVSISTPENPYAGLHVCPARAGGSFEAKNCITLCDLCVRLNSLENLTVDGKDIGAFVELPHLRQSQINMLMRVASTYNELATADGTRAFLNGTPIHTSFKNFLRQIRKTPPAWEKLNFNGSPAALAKVFHGHTGFIESNGRQLYLDRLRFVYSSDFLSKRMSFWKLLLEKEFIGFAEEKKDG